MSERSQHSAPKRLRVHSGNRELKCPKLDSPACAGMTKLRVPLLPGERNKARPFGSLHIRYACTPDTSQRMTPPYCHSEPVQNYASGLRR